MNKKEYMLKTLADLGCRRVRGNEDNFILDGFDGEFYLRFDASDDPERPETIGTCNIMVCRPGESPNESSHQICLMSDCTRYIVLDFLLTLGASRFNPKTRDYLLASGIRR